MIKRIITYIYVKYRHTALGQRLVQLRRKDGIFSSLWKTFFLPLISSEYSRNFDYDNSAYDQRTGLTLRFFAIQCERWESLKDILHADVYIAHNVQSSVFFKSLTNNHNSAIICDVIEHPRLDVRVIKSPIPKYDIELLHDIFTTNLRRCDHLITVSNSLAEQLHEYNVPVSVLENYRYNEPVPTGNYLRNKFKLSDDIKLVLCMSTITQGFKAVLHALNDLPPYIHLVTLGRFVPSKYYKHIKELSVQLRVKDRLHFLTPVPYDQLTIVASSADIGIIVRDPAILNNYISLPNRVFDYISSGLPICSPFMPDIANIVKKYNLGIIIEDISSECWAQGIIDTLNNKDTFSNNAKNTAAKLTWESKEPLILEIVGDAKTVTIFSQKNLSNNNRTKRIARTLAQNGIHVNICSPNIDCNDIDDPNIVFHKFPF